MAEVKVSLVFKDLPVKLQTSKLSDRENIFSQLEAATRRELPDQVLRGLCHVLQLTLPRYNNSKSRFLVEKFVNSLLSFHSSAAKHLSYTIYDAAKEYNQPAVTKNISQICLTCLNWSFPVAVHIFKNNAAINNEECKKLVEAQSLLLLTVIGSQHAFFNKKAQRKFTQLWDQIDVEKYLNVLCSLDASLSLVVMWCFLVHYFDENSNKELISAHKAHFLDLFSKIILSSKSKLPVYVLENTKLLLKHVSHDDFKKQILPTLQKAMLRNPEIIMESVSYVIAGLSLELSPYAIDLGKSLATHLVSKDDLCREETVVACHKLAWQCCSAEAIGGLVSHFMAVLNGSNGKLTIATQRMGILNGIGELSYHTVTGSTSIQELSELVIDQLITVLKSEVHEGTLVVALKVTSKWCGRLTTEVPKQLVSWFDTGTNLKSATSAVRFSYLQCMLSAFHGNTLGQATSLIPLLLKVIDKALAQPNQNTCVSEGLAAACLVFKLCTVDCATDNKLKSTTAMLLDPQKQPYFAEKFIQSASDETIQLVVQLIERMILDHPEKCFSHLKPFSFPLLKALTHPKRLVRQAAQASTKKLVSVLGGINLSSFLLKEFPEFVNNYIRPQADATEKAPEHISRLLSECLITVCSGSNLDTKDVHQLVIETLLPAHHPLIVAGNHKLWIQILHLLKLDPSAAVHRKSDELFAVLLESKEIKPEIQNAIQSFTEILPSKVVPAVLQEVLTMFQKTESHHITRDSYAIYCTPPGELYDRSVLDSSKEVVYEGRNIKRESKLYSYKEQMEEIELRKEIEAKKRAKGLIKEPELSKKQQEAVKQQLEKEELIRNDVKKTAALLDRGVALLSALLEGNSDVLALSAATLFPNVVSCMISLLRSPLAAPEVAPLFVRLSKLVFPEDIRILGLSIAYLTLRLADPECLVDPSWTEESILGARNRVLSQFHDLTCPPQGSNYDEQALALTQKNRLTGPAFAYSFPMLRLVLLNPESEESTVTQCLHIISQHAQMRADASDEFCLKSPKYLPVEGMLQTLVLLIGRTSGQLQQLVAKVVLDVCLSVSGLEGCSRATISDIKVLLSALYYPEVAVREVALQGLMLLQLVLPNPKDDHENGLQLKRQIWLSMYDPNEEIRTTAKRLWKDLNLEPDLEMCALLLSDICHPHEDVRKAASDGLAALIEKFPENLQVVLENLMTSYHDKLVMPEPVRDVFGRVVTEAPPDVWEPRSGIGMALEKLALHMKKDMVTDVMNFFVPTALGDRHHRVQKNMLEAAVAVVDIHGKDTVNTLLPVFEAFLDDTPDNPSFDTVRQSVVILMGTLARHLDKNDPKVKPIVKKLIDALSTPSQQVQEAVASCLPPLVPAIKEDASSLVQKLLFLLLDSENYGERRGAAYGLAGLVKGLGILSLKQLDIMNTLTTAVQDKKSFRHREGALFAFEMLCNILGTLFEPYVIHVLPHLLLCFGDGNEYVREATDNTARAVMSKLTAHGVKLTLPSLLAGLGNESWRTKAGSVELLGAMAYCAPKQLSSCLPSIVPKLIEVLSDSHVKVQKAGAQALKQIGSVIRNPEIQAIVPVLLDALQDPAKKTSPCLATLLNTKFVHVIDAPSLALIMPVVQRAFQDRSTETRKMAVQIIGNMYSLTDQKDLSPYLPTIIPGLKQSLLDPVPEVRSVSSRALGAMIKGMGENYFEDLIPWLMQTLTSDVSPVDRSGAAQGLSEVLGGLGAEKLHKLMPEIITTAERNDIAPHVKDGYIMMFIYLPMVFNKDFTPYIGQIINPILKALADENEYVRETALKAGQRIVNMYAETAITLLLPELEKGLFDDNWRIRYSSVQLLGDLLYKISGVSGKMSTETADEDDNFGTEHSQKAIIFALGEDTRSRVLAGLYMGRLDTSLMVRQAALHVWKVVVTNTPRTLREILPTLFSLLLGFLASSSHDKQQVAAHTLGDLVRKLGERVLPEIIPILERGLDSDHPDQRQGVCIGLSEIMASTSRDMVLSFVDSLVPTVRRALCDPLPEVRQAAAKTFDSLHSTVGSRALDDILSPLLMQLEDSELGEHTLDGLRQVMTVKSRVVLPYLVPQLTAQPVNTKALSKLSAVAGDSLSRHLPKILPALLSAFSSALDTPDEQQELEYCQAVVLSVSDDMGMRTIIDHLLEATKNESKTYRRAAVALLCAYCSSTKADLGYHVPQLLRDLIHLFTDTDRNVLQLAGEALGAVTKTLDTNQQIQYVSDVRQAIKFAVSDMKGQEYLPGFCQEKGISPILPIFREAILVGPPELKEQAAQGLGEVIRLTDSTSLKQSVISITGPLIRILGDRFTFSVKVAVLETLALLLAKVGIQLKPFLPQLQTTFLKALNDGNRQVRLRAALALSHLIVIHTRCDPVFLELHNSIKSQDDSGVKETMLYALRCVICSAGNRMSDTIRRSVKSTVLSYVENNDEACRMAAAGCLGVMCKWLPEEELETFVSQFLLHDSETQEWVIRHGHSVTLTIALKEAADRLITENWTESIQKILIKYMSSERVQITLSGVRGTGYFLRHVIVNTGSVPQALLTTFVKCLNHQINEVKQLVALTAQFLAKSIGEPPPPPVLKALIPLLVNGTKEKNSMVKANSEYALVSLLWLRSPEHADVYQNCLAILDAGARDSLQDVHTKVLRKVAAQAEPREEELDDTVLT